MNINFLGNHYIYKHQIDDNPNTENFKYHNHENMHEICIFIRGNTEFRVEGNTYSLNPYDTIIANHNEFHRPYHNEPITQYERIILNISRRFFVKNNCEHLESVLVARQLGTNNLISGEIVKKSIIPQIIESIDSYLNSYTDVPEFIIRGKIIELLFNINRTITNCGNDTVNNEKIKNIITYINNNLASTITLNDISCKFYINKHYLCRLFKTQTGMTINEYILYKRILIVRELCSMGATLVEASTSAGFSSYSNFYKLYKKATGKSPKEDLIKQT